MNNNTNRNELNVEIGEYEDRREYGERKEYGDRKENLERRDRRREDGEGRESQRRPRYFLREENLMGFVFTGIKEVVIMKNFVGFCTKNLHFVTFKKIVD